MDKKWYRMSVVVRLPNYKREFYFTGTDKKALFISCINFAQGFINGYVANGVNGMTISTNEVQSIDGYYWWNTRTGDKVLYIEDETGKMITTENDL